MRFGAVGCVVMMAVLAGCGLLGRRASAPEASGGPVQLGTASWYGPGFHGRHTSSGEIYDQYDLTAAHRTLPLGTRVAVTNLQNGKEVEVRINDRGPFVKDRMIDLSYAAARILGMIGPGTVPVRLEVLEAGAVQLASVAYAVQVGAFAQRENAERLKDTLSRRFRGVYMSTFDGTAGSYYRVRLGRFAKHDEAAAAARSITPLGLPAVIVEESGRP